MPISQEDPKTMQKLCTEVNRCTVRKRIQTSNAHLGQDGHAHRVLTRTQLGQALKVLYSLSAATATADVDDADGGARGAITRRERIDKRTGGPDVEQARVRVGSSQVDLAEHTGVADAHLDEAVDGDVGDEGSAREGRDGNPARRLLAGNVLVADSGGTVGLLVDAHDGSAEAGVGDEDVAVAAAGHRCGAEHDKRAQRRGARVGACERRGHVCAGRAAVGLDGEDGEEAPLALDGRVALHGDEQARLVIGEEGVRDGVGGSHGRRRLAELKVPQAVELAEARDRVKVGARDARLGARAADAHELVLGRGCDRHGELSLDGHGPANHGEGRRCVARDAEHGDRVGSRVHGEQRLARDRERALAEEAVGRGRCVGGAIDARTAGTARLSRSRALRQELPVGSDRNGNHGVLSLVGQDVDGLAVGESAGPLAVGWKRRGCGEKSGNKKCQRPEGRHFGCEFLCLDRLGLSSKRLKRLSRKGLEGRQPAARME